MKYIPLVLALSIAATPFAHAQTPEKKPAPAAKPADAGAEQALAKIEQDILEALLKRDVAGFGKHFADDAVLTTPGGDFQTKAELLADVKSGALVLQSSTISDMKVKVHGDTAVVTYITTDKGTYKGQDVSGRFRWTDVFVRQGGTWRLLAGHGTQIQAPPK